MSLVPTVCWPGASGYASVYRPLLASLSPDLSPTAMDYPGLGDAPRTPEVESLSALFQVTLSALPKRCNLVSLSMGSLLALRAALEAPERIHRLVLLAPVGGFDALALGASDWRAGWVKRRPDAPRWLVDDRTDFSDRLPTIDIPTLIVVGDADPIAPVVVGHHLRQRMPRARLHVFAGATHDIVEEHGPRLAALIDGHFRASS